MSKIYIYPKKGDVYHFSLLDKIVSLGRSADNDIPLDDQFCSKKHALILPEGTDFLIQDNNSKNGVFLNGKRISKKSILKKGDEILLGSTRIVFDLKIDSNVEVTDSPSSSANINTILNLKDILKNPSMSTTIQADGKSIDIDMLKSQHQDFSIINEVSKALILHKPLDELLEYIMDIIGENLKMDRGILLRHEGHPPQLIAKVVRINSKELINKKIQVSQSIVNTAIEKNSAILISDTQSDTRFKSQQSILNLNIHSAMCVPLWNNKKIMGIIYCDRISLQSPFSKSDLRLLTLLSNLAAVKIENAELYEKDLEREKMEKELQLAAQIQKDLLPQQSPKINNFDIAGTNVPCSQVGGDYYDFTPINPSQMGIAIADVSGKGVSSSLLMASLRASLHSEIHNEHLLNEMAAKLNNFVHKSSAINSFITFCFCDLNHKTGEINYINAGHNPPIILDSRGTVHRLEISGLCLGMFPDLSYSLKKTKLDPGDILLLYTDGFTESRNNKNQEFQESGLIKALKKHSNLPAQKLICAIFDELESFSQEEPPFDDRTIIIIKRTT